MIDRQLRKANAIQQRMAERIIDGLQHDRQNQNQRRNQVVDLYGVEYTRQGDSSNPATFYISVSPDMVYYERFEFKIIVQPFSIPIAGGSTDFTNINVEVANRSLSTNGSSITPNPHNHSATVTPNPHSHNISAGVTQSSGAVNDFEIWIEDIDMTPYLKAQFPDEWINGDGVFPSNALDKYDVLKAAGFLPSWQQGIVLTPGFKKVELRAKGTFSVSLINYLKLSHVNR